VEGLDEGKIVSIPQSNLHAIAHAQLAKKNPQLSALIDRLVKANVHNIVSQTSIVYNANTGGFQTPLGPIKREGIDQARDMLVEIKKCMIKKCSTLPKLVSDYCRVIPQSVGHKFTVESIFPDLDAVQKQGDILDSLEATLASMIKTPTLTKDNAKSDAIEQVFEVDLDVLTDAKECKRLEDYYRSSMKSSHGYSNIKIQQMFKVTVQDMAKAFNKSLGGVQEVYHGTSQANLLSILKSGLKTSPPSTAYIAGKMWGNGVYGAINSSKSLGYTLGRWGGSRGESGWLFVCDFAMGKIDYPTSTKSYASSGCDSIWAKASKTGLAHDELIVYKNNQVNICYLLECR
jgi:poly [ADP-ribose] polymerase